MISNFTIDLRLFLTAVLICLSNFSQKSLLNLIHQHWEFADSEPNRVLIKIYVEADGPKATIQATSLEFKINDTFFQKLNIFTGKVCILYCTFLVYYFYFLNIYCLFLTINDYIISEVARFIKLFKTNHCT